MLKGECGMRKVQRATAALVTIIVLAAAAAAPASAAGHKDWFTSLSTASRSESGCTARGYSASDRATTSWTDSTPSDPSEACWNLGARAYYYAGAQSSWTQWDYDPVNAAVKHGGTVTGRHHLTVE